MTVSNLDPVILRTESLTDCPACGGFGFDQESGKLCSPCLLPLEGGWHPGQVRVSVAQGIERILQKRAKWLK